MKLKKKRRAFAIICLGLMVCISVSFLSFYLLKSNAQEDGEYIKWMEFNPPLSAMEKALKADIDTHDDLIHINWVDLLSALAAKYWGEWGRYSASDMDEFITKLKQGENIKILTAGYKTFNFFSEAYHAVLDGFVGEYKIGTGETDLGGDPIMEEKYGLRAYSPLAYGYGYSHYDDFGTSRNFGYKRRHLGNDLIASVGTPIVAVESGIITNCGWNRYGGWRVGIRSFDGKRYYYYAHLRKDHPYLANIKEGAVVQAGDPIGYVGMTGYSDAENVNGMNVPHLHFGMQLIFDESQIEGENEIWIDVYHLVDLLNKHKSPVIKGDSDEDVTRKYAFEDPMYTEYLNSQ